MNMTNSLSFSKWSRRKEALLSTLVEWVPLSLVKKLIYRSIFARMGNSTQIHSGVKFRRAYGIEIGNRATIESGAILKNGGQDSKIWIGDSATLEAGATLRNGGQNSKIWIGDSVTLESNACLKNCGQNSKIWIGNEAFIEHGAIIKAHRHGTIEIGEKTYIGPYTCLSGRSIGIGKNCLIASHGGIYAGNHVFSDSTRPINEQGIAYKEKGIVIEDDCWLGSGVRVVDGTTIGKGSVIGAGAVVTKDIPPYSVAVGVPAKVIAQRNGAGN